MLNTESAIMVAYTKGGEKKQGEHVQKIDELVALRKRGNLSAEELLRTADEMQSIAKDTARITQEQDNIAELTYQMLRLDSQLQLLAGPRIREASGHFIRAFNTTIIGEPYRAHGAGIILADLVRNKIGVSKE